MIHLLHLAMRTRRQRLACVKLAHMVEQNRNSFSTIDYAKRRKAMLSHTRKDS